MSKAIPIVTLHSGTAQQRVVSMIMERGEAFAHRRISSLNFPQHCRVVVRFEYFIMVRDVANAN
jgi:hypothetical protein